jgi:hypothetical protein
MASKLAFSSSVISSSTSLYHPVNPNLSHVTSIQQQEQQQQHSPVHTYTVRHPPSPLPLCAVDHWAAVCETQPACLRRAQWTKPISWFYLNRSAMHHHRMHDVVWGTNTLQMRVSPNKDPEHNVISIKPTTTMISHLGYIHCAHSKSPPWHRT